MRQNANSTLKEYDKELLKNISSFERDVKRLLRRLDRDERKPAEEKAEHAFTTFRELGRPPDKPDGDSLKQLKNIYHEGLDDQKKIDEEFAEKFIQLRTFYIQGIEKQITALRKEGNDEHADALNLEIEASHNTPDRFMRILRNQEPDPEPEEKQPDDN